MFGKKNKVLPLILQIIIDAVCVTFSYWIAFVLRFFFGPEHMIPYYYIDAFRFTIPLIILICLAVFAAFRFYNTMWEFASMDELLQVVIGTTAACMLSTFFGFFVFPNFFRDSLGWPLHHFPVPVYAMGWLLAMFLIGGSRFLIRIVHHRRVRQSGNLQKEGTLRVMIVGAGEMGSMVIKEMKSAPQYTGVPIVAIDDDRKKRGTRIHGVKVVGGRDSIPRMAAHYHINEIILAIPTAKQSDKRQIISICSATGCRLKTIPALYELIEGNADPLKVRDVDILDLLGRDEIKLNTKEISGYLADKTILVTGGGGTIGSELCRQIACFHPKKLLVLEIYENNAYQLV